METRNVLLAIIFSTLVLVFWSVFFEPPIVEEQVIEKQSTKNQDSSSPTINEDGSDIKNEITRSDIINNTKTIRIES